MFKAGGGEREAVASGRLGILGDIGKLRTEAGAVGSLGAAVKAVSSKDKLTNMAVGIQMDAMNDSGAIIGDVAQGKSKAALQKAELANKKREQTWETVGAVSSAYMKKKGQDRSEARRIDNDDKFEAYKAKAGKGATSRTRWEDKTKGDDDGFTANSNWSRFTEAV